RYQRMVPSAMARTAARSADTSNAPRTASAERPSEITASSACAAPASAGAPGAHGDLAKAPSRELEAVRKIPHRYRLFTRSLHLGDGERGGAARDPHEIVLNTDD